MKTALQVLLIFWFVALSLFVLVPSYQILAKSSGGPPLQSPPLPPPPPASTGEADLANYSSQIQAYQSYLTAYSAYYPVASKSTPDSVYEPVVTKTILPLLEKIIVAFLGYAFVITAGIVIDNYNRLRNSKSAEPIRVV